MYKTITYAHLFEFENVKVICDLDEFWTPLKMIVDKKDIWHDLPEWKRGLVRIECETTRKHRLNDPGDEVEAYIYADDDINIDEDSWKYDEL